jgi:3-oxoacyl-[acyl-carrier-protein] synthase-3|tara:strand:- start:36144 stop:37184 length:1041 start_codon:yes stop_codon:yes gene_type:complete
MNNTKIKSLAIQMPKNSVANDEPPYSEIEHISKTWFRFWGVDRRHIIDRESGETAIELALKASKQAIDLAGIQPEDVDLILCNSTCFDGWSEDPSIVYPRLSHALKTRLNCKNALVLDVDQECLTFLVSMQIANGYLKNGQVKNVLVCASEYISSILDFTDKSSTIFADGAVAAILNKEPNDTGLISSSYKTNAEVYDLAVAQWRNPSYPKKEGLTTEDYGLYFTIEEDTQAKMQKFIPVLVPEVIKEALTKINLTTEDVDFYIFHQTSKTMVDIWANAVGIDYDKYILTVKTYGCLASASTPVTLYEALKQGRIKIGDTVVIAGAAIGWGFGAQVWKIGNKIEIN